MASFLEIFDISLYSTLCVPQIRGGYRTPLTGKNKYIHPYMSYQLWLWMIFRYRFYILMIPKLPVQSYLSQE